MFSLFKNNSNDEQLKKGLFEFLDEMEKNLELYYVMDQRQFIIEGFLTETWGLVKDKDLIKKHNSIVVYAKSTEDFNSSFKAYKDFEAWYTSDINHKTPDNARKLHALKDVLDHQLRAMEAIIITAGQDLEREMVTLGLLKA